MGLFLQHVSPKFLPVASPNSLTAKLTTGHKKPWMPIPRTQGLIHPLPNHRPVFFNILTLEHRTAMNEHGQIPNIYSGSNAFPSLPDNNLTIGWAMDDQPDAMQDIPPITQSSLAQSSVEGCAHKPINTSLAPTCIECHGIFPNHTQLSKHAKDASHKPYGCTCRAKFGRPDALTRHVDTQSSNIPQYPCEYCKRHQGAKGFHRLDHLVQHLKGFHRIDTEDKLPKQRTGGPTVAVTSVAGGSAVTNEENGSFVSLPQIPPFPCTVIGCIKGGADGYLREIDLLEHQNMMHAFMVQGDMQFYHQDGSSQFHF
ncbi:uncharacterized protein F4817DRAFT_363021 [Daldinia loculata]|uniref:uncharacterized protein n=1 Tax=Daldinia loculata TaxID=103429 RepID=UPI0020C2E267|nr:uncharacterized protein F4817DRAFT_363021 [Daldinia loculata]KAI1652045.1 hypothetical protein F4817DRAFT_363021 [Daldinia loculata]